MKSTKKLSRLLSVLLTLALLGATACSSGTTTPPANSTPPALSGDTDPAPSGTEPSAAETITLKVACTTRGDPTVDALFEFANAVTEATEGRIQFEFYDGTLNVAETEQWEMVTLGTMDIGAGNLSTMSNYIPEIGVLSLPFLFHSAEDAEDYLYNSEVFQNIFDQLSEMINLRAIALECSGGRLLSSDLEVTSPADLAGIKIRSMDSQVSQDTVRALGATPIPVSYSELYMALQTGVVQGQENAMASFYAAKLYEVQKNLYMTEHNYNFSLVAMNQNTLDSIPAGDRAIFDEMVQKYLIDGYKDILAATVKEAEATSLDAGVRIWSQDELDMAAFWASGEAVIRERYMDDPAWANIINNIKATYNY